MLALIGFYVPVYVRKLVEVNPSRTPHELCLHSSNFALVGLSLSFLLEVHNQIPQALILQLGPLGLWRSATFHFRRCLFLLLFNKDSLVQGRINVDDILVRTQVEK